MTTTTVASLIPRVRMRATAVPATIAELELRNTAHRFCVETGIWTEWVVTEAGRPLGTIEFTANPSAGDYITFDDGSNDEVTLTFDTDVTIGASKEATMANLVVAINAATLDITASATDPASNLCNLTHDDTGSTGNKDLEYSGTAIRVTGMSSQYYIVSLSYLAASGTEAPRAGKVLEVWVNGTLLGASQYSFDYGLQTLKLHDAPDEYTPDGLKILVEVEPAIAGSSYPDWLVNERYASAIVGGALESLTSTPDRPYTNPVAAARHRLDYARGICRARADRERVYTSRGGLWVAERSNSGGIQG